MIVVAFAAMPFLLMYSAFGLSLLWGWFVTPAFGLPVPSLPVVIGLALIVSFLTHQRTPDDKSIGYALVYSLVNTTFVIAIGFVVSLFA